jgi:hypothetical protein
MMCGLICSDVSKGKVLFTGSGPSVRLQFLRNRFTDDFSERLCATPQPVPIYILARLHIKFLADTFDYSRLSGSTTLDILESHFHLHSRRHSTQQDTGAAHSSPWQLRYLPATSWLLPSEFPNSSTCLPRTSISESLTCRSQNIGQGQDCVYLRRRLLHH